MNTNVQSREKLLHYIDMVSFAVDDVLLYLDTHPCDQDALAYFCLLYTSLPRNRQKKN